MRRREGDRGVIEEKRMKRLWEGREGRGEMEEKE